MLGGILLVQEPEFVPNAFGFCDRQHDGPRGFVILHGGCAHDRQMPERRSHGFVHFALLAGGTGRKIIVDQIFVDRQVAVDVIWGETSIEDRVGGRFKTTSATGEISVNMFGRRYKKK